MREPSHCVGVGGAVEGGQGGQGGVSCAMLANIHQEDSHIAYSGQPATRRVTVSGSDFAFKRRRAA